MRESFWGVMIVGLGITSMFLVYFFQSITNTSEHNYELLKETTEAAMIDGVDWGYYRTSGGIIRVDREKFLESFIRRFAQTATLSHQYHIVIQDVNEEPPKVSIEIETMGSETSTTIGNQSVTFKLTNRIDAILEAKF